MNVFIWLCLFTITMGLETAPLDLTAAPRLASLVSQVYFIVEGEPQLLLHGIAPPAKPVGVGRAPKQGFFIFDKPKTDQPKYKNLRPKDFKMAVDSALGRVISNTHCGTQSRIPIATLCPYTIILDNLLRIEGAKWCAATRPQPES